MAFGRQYGYGGQYNDILLCYLRDRYSNGTLGGTLNDLMSRWDGMLTPLTSPDSVPGLVLWLDSSDTATITDTAGAVDQWDDKSGFGNHAVGTGSNRPVTGGTTINSLNTIAFTAGSSHFLNCGQDSSIDLVPRTNNFTLICVYKVTAGAIIAKAGATISQRQYYMFFSGSNVTTVMGGAFANTSTNPSGVAAVTSVYNLGNEQFVHHNNTLEDQRSNLQVGNSADVLIGARRSTDVNTGATFYMSGEVGEIIMYNHAISDSVRSNITNALISKWGIS